MTTELVVQGPAFVLEGRPFLISGVCEPGIQQEWALTLEYPSPGSAPPAVSCVPDASTSLGSSAGHAVQLSQNVGDGEPCCNALTDQTYPESWRQA